MHTPRPLAGGTAFVTGGAVGIGAAISEGLANAGADVSFTYHRRPADETRRRIERTGQQAIPLPLDVTDRSQVAHAVDQAASALGGRIDILVNNAGGLLDRVPVAEMTDAHWQDVLDLNLTSAFWCTRAALPHVPEGGRIVNVASLAAFDGGGTGGAAYAAAKAGLVALTRGLAKELGARRITVNAVAPGLILETPFHDTFSTKQMKQAAIERTPVGRGGVPDDVAAAVIYLAAPQASFVSGEVIHINGGLFFG